MGLAVLKKLRDENVPESLRLPEILNICHSIFVKILDVAVPIPVLAKTTFFILLQFRNIGEYSSSAYSDKDMYCFVTCSFNDSTM
jgi:hypothetical protein